jgi:hypothetical protein
MDEGVSAGLLILRVIVGIVMFAHGYNHVFRCDEVFGPEERDYDPTSAPALVRIIDPNRRLCAKCFSRLTDPPPNRPRRGGASSRRRSPRPARPLT